MALLPREPLTTGRARVHNKHRDSLHGLLKRFLGNLFNVLPDRLSKKIRFIQLTRTFMKMDEIKAR